MSRKGKICLGLAVLILAAAAVVWAWQIREKSEEPVSVLPGVSEYSRAVRAEVAAIFEKMADDINASVDLTSDEPVLLVHVDAGDGPSITYHYQVGAEYENFVLKEAEDMLHESVCTLPDMRDYMQYGIWYGYRYVNAEGKELAVLRIDEESCRAYEARKKDSGK